MDSVTAADTPQYQALIELLRTADTVWNCSRVFFARWDLSASQFNVLNLLSTEPDGLSQIELGRLLITHRSNITGLVDRLAKKGLVKRKDVASDRRAYSVILTTTGRKLLNKILPEYHRVANEVWSGFRNEQARQFKLELQQLRENAQKIAETMQDP
jgi:DNA-binding MarR family transcriptional regulator